jgi:hypothetical protein
MADQLMARFEGVRRLAALTVVLSLFLACGPREGGHLPGGPSPPPALAVSSVAPNPAISGVTVTISGSGFRAGVAVTFGGVIAEVLDFSGSWIRARTPELAPGRVVVVVTNTNGESATLACCFALDPPPPGGVTVSGTVLEFTTSGLVGPVPNVRLIVRRGRTGLLLGDLPDVVDVVTDANGRYSIPNVPADEEYSVLYLGTAPGSEYRSFCNAWPVRVGGAGRTDLPVVHNSWSGNRLPPGMWTKFGTVHGVVSERVDGHSQPIEGATVSGQWMENPPATTSATGFYMSCTSLGHSSNTLTAQKAGYNPAGREIELGFEFEINFELTRSGVSPSRR